MYALDLLKRGKIPTGTDTQTKCGTETERNTIQRLDNLRMHPIKVLKPRHYCRCLKALPDLTLI